MNEIPYSNARTQLAALLDKAIEDREAIIITRRGKESVALVPADEYRSLLETAYLLRSPKNAERLLQALADARSGKNLHRMSIEELERKLDE